MNFNQSRSDFKKQLLRQYQKGHAFSETTVGVPDVAGKPVGKLKIEAIYDNGQLETLLDENNLVVKQAENLMALMSMGVRRLDYIELGDAVSPNAPQLTDLTLQQTTGLRKSTDNSTSGNSGIHVAFWNQAEGNGYVFTEAGLFSDPFGAGIMFARKVFAPIEKLASFALKFTWGIVYNVREHNEGCSGIALLGGSTIASDYTYIALGGEEELLVPIDFQVAAKQLDVFLNGQRLVYNRQYYESSLGASRGIKLIGIALSPDDVVYFITRKLA